LPRRSGPGHGFGEEEREEPDHDEGSRSQPQTAEDKPGFLAKVLKRIGDEEINLTVTYTLTNTRIAIGSNRTARVKEIVQEFSRITA
jgi:hypothetical protein